MSDEPGASPAVARAPRAAAGPAPVPPAALPPDDPWSLGGAGRALPAAHPPDSFVPLRRWVLETPAELRALRHELRDQVAASVAPDRDEAVDDVVLVASELATNALAHGRPPAHVRLAHDGADVLLVVSDCDTAHAPFVAEGRAPGEGGFGLQIARRLSAQVGWWSDGSGKHVWAAFRTDGATDGA